VPEPAHSGTSQSTGRFFVGAVALLRLSMSSVSIRLVLSGLDILTGLVSLPFWHPKL
jgi:hypothetical protein